MAHIRVFKHWGISREEPLARPRPSADPVRFAQTQDDLPLPVSEQVSKPFEFRFRSSFGPLLGGACFGRAQLVRDEDDPFILDPLGQVPQGVLDEMRLVAVRPSVSAGTSRGFLEDLVVLADAGRDDLIERWAGHFAVAARFSAYPQMDGIGKVWGRRDVTMARVILRIWEETGQEFRRIKQFPTLEERRVAVQPLLHTRNKLNQALSGGPCEPPGKWTHARPFFRREGNTLYCGEEVICAVSA